MIDPEIKIRGDKMVNTFLVDKDFRKSAEKLDSKRLGKQRVEAYQIHQLIVYLNMLSSYYSIKPPNNPYQLQDFIREISRKYKQENCQLLWHPKNGWISIPKDHKMIRLAADEKIESMSETEVLVRSLSSKTNKVKSYPIDQIVFPDQILISLGFVSHPAVLLWFHSLKCLEYYINVHIEEWVRRGNNNFMSLYEVGILKPSDFPVWTQDSYFHDRHKSNLLKKEPDHYSQFPDFVQIGPELPYFWPFTSKTSNGICDSNSRYQHFFSSSTTNSQVERGVSESNSPRDLKQDSSSMSKSGLKIKIRLKKL